MAVAKMVRLTAIVEHNNRNKLMKEMQALQKVEVRDLENDNLLNRIDTDRVQLNDAEDHLLDIQAASEHLQRYVPEKSFKEKYMGEIPAYTFSELEAKYDEVKTKEIIRSVWQYKQRIEEVQETQKRIDQEENFLTKWEKLSVLPEADDQYKHIKLFIGTIPQAANNQFINAIRHNQALVVEEIYQNAEEFGLVVIGQRENSQEIEALLLENRFQPLDYRYEELPAERLRSQRQLSADNRKEAENLRNSLAGMENELVQLKIAEEVMFAEFERLKAEQGTLQTSQLFAVEGWTLAEEAEKVTSDIRQEFGDDVFLELHEVKDEEVEDVPVQLKNNGFSEPFEMITTMYATPKYTELDPTPWLSPYYWFFFGMMMADAGYGLFMWIATIIPLKFFNLAPGIKKFLRFGHALSYATVIWGLIYGSFFGASLPFSLLSPTEDVIEVLALSIGFGFIQIINGLALNTYIQWKTNKLAAIKDGLAWIIILFGFLLAVIGPLLFDIQILTTIGLGMAGFGALLVLGIAIISQDNKFAGLAVGLYDLYGVSSYLGDLVSYSRLMALGIAGGSIALAFNILIQFLPPVARFTVGILLFVFLHLFNIGLSLLSAYVHGARLIFVEFFGKFYEGGGKAFAPLKMLEKHIRIK